MTKPRKDAASPEQKPAAPKNPGPSVGEIYDMAERIIIKADRFTRGIQRGKSSCANDAVRLLAEFDAETWRMLWILGDEEDAGVVFNDPSNTHLEHQIASSRQHRPAILCGNAFPSALRAVISVSRRIVRVVSSTIKPGTTIVVDLFDLSESFADADVVQRSYLEQFTTAGVFESGGWNQGKWLAFCERCVASLPEFDLRSAQTMLFMEKAGVYKEHDLPISPATVAKLTEAISDNVVAKLGQPPVVEAAQAIISHGNQSYSFGKTKPVCVSVEEDSVLQAFAANKASMTTQQLEKHVANVSRVISKLSVKFLGAVHCPKVKGEGYYIAVNVA